MSGVGNLRDKQTPHRIQASRNSDQAFTAAFVTGAPSWSANALLALSIRFTNTRRSCSVSSIAARQVGIK